MDKRSGSPSRARASASKKQRSLSKASAGKKQRSVSKARSAGGRKVGIVCHARSDNEVGDYEVKIYVVDLDLHSSQPCGTLVTEYPAVEPVVKFVFPKQRYALFAVCVLNNTVYMFEGCDIPIDDAQNSARRFVLSEKFLGNENYVLMGEELEKIAPMHHRKVYPEAIPTPDGKHILVFGKLFKISGSSSEFELYDLGKNQWEKLPRLPWRCVGDKCIDVTDYTFVGKSHFLMVTNEASFALDLHTKKWAVVDTPPIYRRGYFVSVKGRYGISSKGVGFDFGNGQFLSEDTWSRLKIFDKFPLSTFTPPHVPDWVPRDCGPSIISLDPIVQEEGEAKEGEVCNTCILRVEEDDSNARVLIDVCHTDLYACNTIVSKRVSLHIYFLDNLFRLNLISL